MDVQYKNAIDFLLWSYFNLTLEDGADADKLLNVCIQKAYLDATQQGAYNAQISKENNELKDKSKEAKQVGMKVLKDAILQLQGEEDSFDEWHRRLCSRIKEVYQEICMAESLFTYGNAQKWVNMALKYLYILQPIYEKCYPDCEFCKTYGVVVQNYGKNFHIPVDSFIIEAAWEKVEPPLRRDKCHTGRYSSEKTIPWSKWEKYEQYLKFQNDLKKAEQIEGEDFVPLDWEGPAWIEIAKKRKG